jgi:hypothetical protein
MRVVAIDQRHVRDGPTTMHWPRFQAGSAAAVSRADNIAYGVMQISPAP